MFAAAAAAADKSAKDMARLNAKAEGKDPEAAAAEAEGDPYLGAVARMASNAAFQGKDIENAYRFAELMTKDPALLDEAVGYMRYFTESNV